jgi:hypothetical protein
VGMDSEPPSKLRVDELYRGEIDRVTPSGRGIVRNVVCTIDDREKRISFQSPTFVSLESLSGNDVNKTVVFRYKGGVQGEVVEIKNENPLKGENMSNMNRLLNRDL